MPALGYAAMTLGPQESRLSPTVADAVRTWLDGRSQPLPVAPPPAARTPAHRGRHRPRVPAAGDRWGDGHGDPDRHPAASGTMLSAVARRAAGELRAAVRGVPQRGRHRPDRPEPDVGRDGPPLGGGPRGPLAAPRHRGHRRVRRQRQPLSGHRAPSRFRADRTGQAGARPSRAPRGGRPLRPHQHVRGRLLVLPRRPRRSPRQHLLLDQPARARLGRRHRSGP